MLSRYDLFLDTAVVLLAIALYLWKHGPPSARTMEQTIEMLNTKGGIIMLLWVTSMVFFFSGLRVMYWGVNMMLDNKLSSDNAMILSCFNWITGAAFGGAFGALLKTMTGDQKPRDDAEDTAA